MFNSKILDILKLFIHMSTFIHWKFVLTKEEDLLFAYTDKPVVAV